MTYDSIALHLSPGDQPQGHRGIQVPPQPNYLYNPKTKIPFLTHNNIFCDSSKSKKKEETKDVKYKNVHGRKCRNLLLYDGSRVSQIKGVEESSRCV